MCVMEIPLFEADKIIFNSIAWNSDKKFSRDFRNEFAYFLDETLEGSAREGSSTKSMKPDD